MPILLVWLALTDKWKRCKYYFCETCMWKGNPTHFVPQKKTSKKPQRRHKKKEKKENADAISFHRLPMLFLLELVSAKFYWEWMNVI